MQVQQTLYIEKLFFLIHALNAGILREKTIADTLIKDYTQNYPFCRLQFEVETFGHSN